VFAIQRKEMVPDRICIVQVCFVVLVQIFGAKESDRQVKSTQDFDRRSGSKGAT
jgi:hypothetical protein